MTERRSQRMGFGRLYCHSDRVSIVHAMTALKSEKKFAVRSRAQATKRVKQRPQFTIEGLNNLEIFV